MRSLLEIWLGDVPQYTVYFGSTFLLMQIVDQLSGGLALANRAMGNIGKYTLFTYTPKLFVIPLAWLSLKLKMSLLLVCGLMFFFEVLSMLLRILLLRKNDGFCSKSYFVDVIIKSLIPFIITSAVCYGWISMCAFDFRFVVTFVISIIVFVISAYSFTLTKDEKDLIHKFLGRIIYKRG